jgi:hypothetical protein
LTPPANGDGNSLRPQHRLEQEIDDVFGQLLTGVFLKEMAGARDYGMVDALGSPHRLVEYAAIGPVIGSESLNATSIGVGLAHNAAHAARLASVAGSSGEVGTRPGMARGPPQ